MTGSTQIGSERRGNLWRMAMWGTAALLLLLPLVAMQLTEEVDWSPADFVVFGAMLLVACGAYELAARMSGNGTYRAAAGGAIATAFFLVWSNLAVGLIGGEGNPANLMYGGVLAVGVVGALLARVRPQGMARALVATALAQAVVGAIAVLRGLGEPASGPLEILGLTGLFVALWLASAGLFRRAARQQRAVGAAP